jgi:hypothetical protein
VPSFASGVAGVTNGGLWGAVAQAVNDAVTSVMTKRFICTLSLDR